VATSRISEAEWEVMEIVWKQPPSTANDIIEALAHRAWAPTTIRTMLTRLVDKKVLSTKKEKGGIAYRAVASREECARRETESFLGRVFSGSANPLLVHFVKRAKLSPEEVRELQKILRAKGES
jgi:BlaI family transcriptional regulator, penicillinase repressor